MKYKILAVDDEPANIRLLERLFRTQFDVVTATSGAEGLELLSVHDIALIISDQRMPGMTGVEFLMRAAEIRPHCVRIILTGYTDANALVEALNSGVVYKYVTKPWVNADLQQTVRRGLSHHETIRAQHRLNLENKRLRDRLDASEAAFLKIFTEMMNLKDVKASGHAERTRDIAEEIGRALKFESADLKRLTTAAYLHGIAELTVPYNLRLKIADLDENERAEVLENRADGLDLLASVPGLDEVMIDVRYQFENYDGSGFGEGLIGAQIPLNSRIIAVADAYDHLTAPDESNGGMTDEQATAILRSEAGTRFDPDVVNVFCGLRSIAQIGSGVHENLMYLHH